MLVFITKASDDYFYKFKNIKKIEDVLSISPRIVIEENIHTCDEVRFWDGFKTEDIPKLKKAKINIIIYDDYIE